MRSAAALLLLTAVILFTAGKADAAGNHCTLIVDYRTSEIIHEDGDCKTRQSPQSTFKIALALMGFDSGILKDAHNPALPYSERYQATREEERHETDPQRWLKDSIVWYSQELTKKLGPDKFQRYVDMFEYGNRDLSGDPGKNNGLTSAWLSSSLKISPVEQVAFVRGILSQKFPVKNTANKLAESIMPRFKAGDWNIYGKTGSGYLRTADGSLDRDHQEGWFVGWADRADQKYIFASFLADDGKTEGYAGPRVRDAFLKDFPAIMKRDRQNRH